MNGLEVAIELQKLSVTAMQDATSLAAIAQALLLGKTSEMHGVMRQYVRQGRSEFMQVGTLAKALREQDRKTPQDRKAAIEAAPNVILFGNGDGRAMARAVLARWGLLPGHDDRPDAG